MFKNVGKRIPKYDATGIVTGSLKYVADYNEADQLIAKILGEGIYNAGDEVAVMVNGMGGTPLMELYVANTDPEISFCDTSRNINRSASGCCAHMDTV